MIVNIIKRYFVLVLVAALLVGSFLLNVKANGEPAAAGDEPQPAQETGAGEPEGGAQVDEDYFESFRREREEVRALEMQYLDEVIAASASDDETLADASQQKLALVENMEKEFTIESLVKAKGFEDAAVTFHAGTVNVVVKCRDELTSEQVAQILDIAQKETGEKAGNIKVMTGQ